MTFSEKRLARFSQEIARLIQSREIRTASELNVAKLRVARHTQVLDLPTNPDILSMLENPSPQVKAFLSIKPVRTLSGVSPLAIMGAPIACAHGKCTFCPGGPGSVFGDVPQSYTGNEPASMRAVRNDFDPYLQTFNRLAQYIVLGHCPEKVEFIFMGGTFPSFPGEYRCSFAGFAFKALNDFSDAFFFNNELNWRSFNEFFEFPHPFGEKPFQERVRARILALKGFDSPSLEREHARNESSIIRGVGLCIETKPDWCLQAQVNDMLFLGCTRIELGVQCLDDEILRKTNRGHSLEQSIEATQLAKDAFLKVGYHMMPGLPGSSLESDMKMFEELFSNPSFKPDALKIYPCTVVKGTPLYEQWVQGAFTPISVEDAVRVIVHAKKFIPEWCRIHRIQRDIPSPLISAGVNRTNLRQYVEAALRAQRMECRCLRCREAGLAAKSNPVEILSGDLELRVRYYSASKGLEAFISLEDSLNDVVLGFCRVRLPFQCVRPEITPRSAGVRELHTFGRALSIDGVSEKRSFQHKGVGKMLMAEAERLAKEEWDCRKLVVISGVGVRPYYIQKLGYSRDGVYVSKRLE